MIASSPRAMSRRTACATLGAAVLGWRASAALAVPAAGQDIWGYLASRCWRGQAHWPDMSIRGDVASAEVLLGWRLSDAGSQAFDGRIQFRIVYEQRRYQGNYNIAGTLDRRGNQLNIERGTYYQGDTIPNREWAGSLTGQLKFGNASLYRGHYALVGSLWAPSHSTAIEMQYLDLDNFTDPFPTASHG